MNRSQSLFAWFRRLSRRERRVVSAGAAVCFLGLLTIGVAIPFAGRWQDREDAIAARQSQLGQLRSLVEGEAATREGLVVRQRERVALRERLLTGATPALAASNLQGLLQGYADGSRVTLDRVDVVAEPGATSEEGLPAIPVQLSGQGDIYGLSELLTRFQSGPKLLIVDELKVTGGNPEYQPDLLNFSVRLHGAYSPE
jgi:hypothetical protein